MYSYSSPRHSLLVHSYIFAHSFSIVQAGGPSRDGGIKFDSSVVEEVYYEYLMNDEGRTDDRKQDSNGAAPTVADSTSRDVKAAAESSGVETVRAPRSRAAAPRTSRVTYRQMLEYSSYLEHYLWPNLHAGASFEHVFSIVLVRSLPAHFFAVEFCSSHMLLYCR
jgi:hypothetical protein